MGVLFNGSRDKALWGGVNVLLSGQAGLLGPGCVPSVGSCGRVLTGRGAPDGDCSPRGSPCHQAAGIPHKVRL